MQALFPPSPRLLSQLLKECTGHRDLEMARAIVPLWQTHRLQANPYVSSALIKALVTGGASFTEVKAVFQGAWRSGNRNVAVCNAAIDAAARTGDKHAAFEVTCSSLRPSHRGAYSPKILSAIPCA